MPLLTFKNRVLWFTVAFIAAGWMGASVVGGAPALQPSTQDAASRSTDQDNDGPATESSNLKADAIKALRLKVEASIENEEKRASCLASLANADLSLQQMEAFEQGIKKNTAAIETASQTADSILAERDQLKGNLDRKSKTADATGSVEELEAKVNRANSSLDTLRKDLAKATADANLRVSHINDLREQIAAKEESVAALEPQLASVSDVLDPTVADECRRLELGASLQLLKREVAKLNSDIRLNEAKQAASVFELTVEVLNLKIKKAEATLTDYQDALEAQRLVATQKAAGDAQLIADRAPTVLRPFAKETSDIAADAEKILGPLANANDAKKNNDTALNDLKIKANATRTRVAEIGLSDSIGAYLRKRKDDLPTQFGLASSNLELNTETDQVQVRLFDYQDQLQGLSLETLMGTLDLEQQEISVTELEKIQDAASQLVEKRKTVLKQAIKNHESYLIALWKLQQSEKALFDASGEYSQYIDELILWVRSNKMLFVEPAIDSSDRDVLSLEKWQSVAIAVGQDFRKNYLIYLMWTAVALLLIALSPQMKHQVDYYGSLVSRRSNTQFMPTLQTTLITAARALPLPMLMFALGWRLTGLVAQDGISMAVGQALLLAAWFYFPFQFVQKICASNGLGQSHFGWSELTIKKIRKELGWFIPFGTVLSFCGSVFYFASVEHRSDTVERLLFLLAMSGITVLLFRVLHPHKGILTEYFVRNPESWTTRMRGGWRWILAPLPLILMAMTFWGYYYSAIQMTGRLYTTAVFVILLELIRALISRAILVSRRRAKIESYRAKIAAQSTEEATENSGATPVYDVNDIIAESEAVMQDNVLRSRKLIRATVLLAWFFAFWIIWSDVFPAIKGLDRFVLWTTKVESAEVVGDLKSPTMKAMEGDKKDVAKADNGLFAEPTTQIKKVTIRNLLTAMLVLGISVFLLRNLPGFLELTLLRHLPVEPSLRHAFKAITGYVILLVGMVIAFRVMWIGWSQVQWLATALTFGLAFGLQEIFANFIAGIILLLERPIRIGDIVTVESVTGTVSKIRIRATTIMDFDRKEYVVPNREFITGRVLNWTLTDQVNRLTITVGVAYGTDVVRAKRLLAEICESNPMVVESPETSITFEEFGDSTLNLVVRTYLRDYSCRLAARDELHTAINTTFEEAGIEIAFPQRDLNIRSLPNEVAESIAAKK